MTQPTILPNGIDLAALTTSAPLPKTKSTDPVIAGDPALATPTAPPTGEPDSPPTFPWPVNAPTTPKKEKVTFRVEPDLMGRIRSNIATRIIKGDPMSLSAFVEHALEMAVRADEDRYNDGKPYAPTPVGVITPGPVAGGRP